MIVKRLSVTLTICLLSACGGGTTSGTVAPTVPASTPPGAPIIGTATAGNGAATIAFTAPTPSGGAAITGYTATRTAGSASETATGAASPLTVGGLVNGTAYSCSVTAANSVDTSAASAAVAVTPVSPTASQSPNILFCHR
jgi:large repetitive protein